MHGVNNQRYRPSRFMNIA